jgi:hypothetical protein
MPVIAGGSLDDTLGALQIGAILAVYLFGIITLQAYTYFRHFPEDKTVFKALVRSSFPPASSMPGSRCVDVEGRYCLDVRTRSFSFGVIRSLQSDNHTVWEI